MVNLKLFNKKLEELKTIISQMSRDELETFQKNMSHHIYKSNLPRLYKDKLIKVLYEQRN